MRRFCPRRISSAPPGVAGLPRLLRRSRALPATIALLLLLVSVPRLAALAVANPVYGYSLDLPVGWYEADNSDPAHVGFYSPNADAMVQVIALEEGGSATAIARLVLDQIDSPGDPHPFAYQDRPAAISDLGFTTGGLQVRGYLVTISNGTTGFAIMGFASEERYEAAHDHILSAIDSFSIGVESRVYPGPVSQFYHPFPAPGARTAPIPFAGGTLPLAIDPDELEATEVLVDREARILAPYGALDREAFSNAWRRYFRMIYRDNYMRLEPVATAIGRRLDDDRVARVDRPQEILSWLQGFDYVRTGGLSDFQPPISCLATGTGDCDSLALTYAIILHQLGYDAILMVSDRYAHALAAVDVPGPGARFAFEGRQWLVAELTADVEIGQIAANMADPDGWLGVRLRLVER